MRETDFTSKGQTIMTNLNFWTLAVLLASATPLSAATFTVTIEAPGVQEAQTAISGATGVVVESFDSFGVSDFDSSGSTLNSSGIGTYSGGTPDVPPTRTTGLQAANAFGGAGGTGQYLFVDEFPDALSPVELALDSDASYFGFWWSAGNSSNEVDFFSGTDLLFSFTSSDVSNFIASLGNAGDYGGNPNQAFLDENDTELYVFINFFSDMPFNRVEFRGLNFESDNHTIATSFETVSGTDINPIPLPAAGWLMVGAIAALAVSARQRRAEE